MANLDPHRVLVTCGAFAGGLLATALFSAATATADQILWVPDPGTFDPISVSGSPPYSPGVATGSEDWQVLDVTNGTFPSADDFSAAFLRELGQPDLSGIDTHTVYGFNMANDYFVASHQGDSPIMFQVDLFNFGNGYENEFVYGAFGDTTPGGVESFISDVVVTPSGDISLLGPDIFLQHLL